MKIALIGPGIMEIPPKGWGALETLIWKYNILLTKKGHEVVIFNSKNIRSIVNEINNGKFDFVHVHYDEFGGYFARNLKQPFCLTSQYGHILQREHWAQGYYSVFKDDLLCDGLITVSPEINKLYTESGYAGKLYVLPNGINVNEFSFKEKGNNRVLCLGKVEPRKRQAWLSDIIQNEIEIDFVGPKIDENFKETETCKYKGQWTTDEVRKNMTEYSTLVLLSSGEAHPFVVIEALASGLSVVISEASSANIDRSLPFVKILDERQMTKEVVISSLRKSVEENELFRHIARNYVLSEFDNSKIIEQYISIINDFRSSTITKQKCPSVVKYAFQQNKSILYLFSSFWVICSHITIFRLVKDFFTKYFPKKTKK